MKTRKQIKLESQPLSLLDKILKRHKGIIPKTTLPQIKTDDKIKLIEQISSYIIRNPEKNLKHLQTLFHISEEKQLLQMMYALLSIVAVFKNVCPLYKINENELQERLKTKITKQERMQILYEQTLIMFYKKYLVLLDKLSGIGKKELRGQGDKKSKVECDRMQVIITRCYSELLLHLGHFNFFYVLTEKFVERIKMKNPAIKLMCMETLEKIFKRNLLG